MCNPQTEDLSLPPKSAMAAAVLRIRRRNERERQQWKAAFRKYDADESGYVDLSELELALKDIGLEIGQAARQPHVQAVIDEYLPNRTSKLDEREFIKCVQAMVKAERDQKNSSAGMKILSSYLPTWPGHERARVISTNKYVQLVVAAMITINFIVNCIEKEIDPYPVDLQLHTKLWNDFDRAFNIIFLFELLLNAWGCGGPYKKFWSSGWNVFDFLVVATGLILMMDVLEPDNPLSNLKMLRAFRVFRLFKRIKSLNKVVMALLRAIPGVMNAFVIMVGRHGGLEPTHGGYISTDASTSMHA